jgi:hypothetical protein
VSFGLRRLREVGVIVRGSSMLRAVYEYSIWPYVIANCAQLLCEVCVSFFCMYRCFPKVAKDLHPPRSW